MFGRALFQHTKQLAQERLPTPARTVLRDIYRRIRSDFYPYESWSQTGEDQILRELFGDIDVGFYVDVGAAHPKYGSNTYLLYKRGWTGINIDAAPGSMKAFRRQRPRDLNLEIGIANALGTLPFYMFADDDALNTFHAELAQRRAQRHRIERIVDVPTDTLANILTQHHSGQIHLLSVDCEGYDEQVLRSNDWTLFRPRVVVVEALEGPASPALPLRVFLEQRGYVLAAATPFNLIFRG